MDLRQPAGTDHKTRTNDEHILQEDKQELQESDPREQPMIPKAGTNPALRELREEKHGKPSPGDEEG